MVMIVLIFLCSRERCGVPFQHLTILHSLDGPVVLGYDSSLQRLLKVIGQFNELDIIQLLYCPYEGNTIWFEASIMAFYILSMCSFIALSSFWRITQRSSHYIFTPTSYVHLVRALGTDKPNKSYRE